MAYIQAFYSVYTTKIFTRLCIQVANGGISIDTESFKKGYDYYPTAGAIIDSSGQIILNVSYSGLNYYNFNYASSQSVIGEVLTYRLSYALYPWKATNEQYVNTVEGSETWNYPDYWHLQEDGKYYRYEIVDNNVQSNKYDVFKWQKEEDTDTSIKNLEETANCTFYPYPYPGVNSPIFQFLYSNIDRKWKANGYINDLVTNLNEFIIKVQQWGNWWGNAYDTKVPSLTQGNFNNRLSAQGVNSMYEYFGYPPNYPTRSVDGNILTGEFTQGEPVSEELFIGLAQEFTKILAKDKNYPIIF